MLVPAWLSAMLQKLIVRWCIGRQPRVSYVSKPPAVHGLWLPANENAQYSIRGTTPPCTALTIRVWHQT